MHVPVMLFETIEYLAIRPGGSYVDATLGNGGHAELIARQAGATGRLLGIDRDPTALARAAERLRGLPGDIVLTRGNHHDLGRLMDAHGFAEADGVLIDCGVSSEQLDTPSRGFSFQQDGPLDMRMDPDSGATAAELLARLDVAEMTRLFRTLGEEPQAGRIARAIARAREAEPITTTGRLAEVVTRASGGRPDRRRHPATRVFQALRMAVNGEMEALEAALEAAMARLRPDGRLAVIVFESLTGRLVKRCMTEHVGRQAAQPQGGVRWEGRRPAMAWVARGAAKPGARELADNPRARSAQLRAVRRLTPAEEPRLTTPEQ
ncbi:MAG: 16S rRNA (cytosine(1402)-N(4))-methyltransferase RsmH [Kiritimatiellae bacterium]|nr:16S rRNA (cytosine(1402)-N(4))-methyltransferase RsmH [Kiritimatiellia bacterium]